MSTTRQEPVLQLTDERETARMLRVSRACLRHWRARGEGPPWLRMGKWLVRYDVAEVRKWIERQASVAR